MFFLSDSDSSEEENKRNLIVERRLLRQKSCIFNMPDEKFENYFRLNKSSFKYLMEAIEPYIKKGIRSTSVPNTIKLAATLRFLALGSYQLSVGNDYNLGLSQPVVSRILGETLDAIESEICPQWIKFNMTNAERNEAKLHFIEKTGFPGVIGCVDGIHIQIIAPTKEMQHLYLNSKGYFSLNVMIICDHKMRIRYLDAQQPGSSHDSLVWNMSQAKRSLQTHYDANDRNSWLLGDAGYPLEPYLMTPYQSASEGSAESVFNLRHAKARNIIERTIRVLQNRFRCLLGTRPLHYNPSKSAKIVKVCAALHNICIRYGVNIPSQEISTVEDSQVEITKISEITNSEALEIRNRIKELLFASESEMERTTSTSSKGTASSAESSELLIPSSSPPSTSSVQSSSYRSASSTSTGSSPSTSSLTASSQNPLKRKINSTPKNFKTPVQFNELLQSHSADQAMILTNISNSISSIKRNLRDEMDISSKRLKLEMERSKREKERHLAAMKIKRIELLIKERELQLLTDN